MESNQEAIMAGLLDKVRGTEGYLLELEMIALLHIPLLVDHVDGALVEIGSYKGKSTVALALGSQCLTSRKRPVYAIDPFRLPGHPAFPVEYEEDFIRNIQRAGIAPHVIPIKKFSQEAYHDCPPSIAALFIDGDHSYEGVKHDITHYASRVTPGGIIAFHDYSYKHTPGVEEPGVTRAVDELCSNPNYVVVNDYNSLRLVRKLG